MKRVVFASLAAAIVAAGTGSLYAQGRAHEDDGQIFVPGSSQEGPDDHGLRAHTNHVLHIRPQATGTAPAGETPGSISSVYNVASTGGSGVIAIVDAYDYPTAAADLDKFSVQFGLPRVCSVAPGTTCINFEVKYANGRQPRANCGWAQESALDIEWAHAMAPKARIVLVEAASSSFTDLFQAVGVAKNYIATNGDLGEISMSWGGSEFSSERSYDSTFTAPGGSSIVFFAASGDTGGRTIYPGVSPNVVSAGGTRINRNSSRAFTGETGWSGSGGGPSAYEPRPSYQTNLSVIAGNHRGVPDFSFDADPASGVSVYDSTSCQGYSGWMVFGGTSVASPSLAGIVNAANHFYLDSPHELSILYSNLGKSAMFRDITSGSAGSYSAKTGWDFVTGVGSNQGYDGK
ncbi:MAG: S53 family peptidase [Acidobacteriia bacterium]|nr:S53 family peptidase [Terriglobia bacterium]